MQAVNEAHDDPDLSDLAFSLIDRFARLCGISCWTDAADKPEICGSASITCGNKKEGYYGLRYSYSTIHRMRDMRSNVNVKMKREKFPDKRESKAF